MLDDVLRYAILTLTLDGELSGYDLSKLFDSTSTYVWPAGQNQIYPELQKLESEGLLAGTGVDQDGRPAKRVFRTTEAGRAALDAWVATPPGPPLTRDAFQLRVFNFGRVPLAVSLKLIDEQEAFLRQRIAIFETMAAGFDAAAATQPAQDGFRIALEAGILTHRAYLQWCAWARQRVTANAG